jgi:hypothetical protein
MTSKADKLKNLKNDQLIDAIKNYRQYGYDENLRSEAISILLERGISKEYMELTGNLENKIYDEAVSLYNSFNINLKTAFVLYGIALLTNILIPILTTSSESIGLSTSILSIAALVLYLFFLIRSFIPKISIAIRNPLICVIIYLIERNRIFIWQNFSIEKSGFIN